MPIKIPNKLPATKILTDENIFVMTETRALAQDIRPLKILVLNLMPTKIDTETQLCRLLGNTPLQVDLTLMNTSSYRSKNVTQKHLETFYVNFEDIKNRFFDGFIITGAPVEQMDFCEVDYWEELCEIMEWSKTHAHSTLHICWGAQAGLYYHYGINKHMLDKKLSGVFPHHVDYKKSQLFRGFDDVFMIPHSRNTAILREDIEKNKKLKVIASSDEAGVYAVTNEPGTQVFITGHSEYDPYTLDREYRRDLAAGLSPEPPRNYYLGNDPDNPPVVTWRSSANLLFSNWLNYYVYQTTPYEIDDIANG